MFSNFISQIMGRKIKDVGKRSADERRRKSNQRGVNLLQDTAVIRLGHIDPDEAVTNLLLKPEMEALRDDPEMGRCSVIPVGSVSFELKRVTDIKMTAELPALLTKALELMISEISLRGYLSARLEDPGRKRIRSEDFTAGLSSVSKFDFLRDVLPQDELSTILRMHKT